MWILSIYIQMRVLGLFRLYYVYVLLKGALQALLRTGWFLLGVFVFKAFSIQLLGFQKFVKHYFK